MVDYSKWNSFDCSDASQDEQEILETELLEFCQPTLPKCIHTSSSGNQASNARVIKMPTQKLKLQQQGKKSRNDQQQLIAIKAWKQHQDFFKRNPTLKFDPKIVINSIDVIPLIHPIFFTSLLMLTRSKGFQAKTG